MREDTADDLRRYRFHTGAELSPVLEEQGCPMLVRDLGFAALARHLRGTLPRLAGPLTPLLYMRTVDFTEPYTDYENIGRLVFLQPLALRPWFSGVRGVYVARATREIELSAVGFCPGDVPLSQVEEFFASLYRQGKPAQFVRYWGEGHVLESPANVRDMWARILAWLDWERAHLGDLCEDRQAFEIRQLCHGEICQVSNQVSNLETIDFDNLYFERVRLSIPCQTKQDSQEGSR